MRKSLLTIVGASALTLSIAATAVACGGQGKIFRSLDLTSDQDDQVHALFDSKRDEMKAMKAKRKALKEKRKALADNYDENLANEIATEAGELATAATLSRIQHQQSVLAILTDEQKEKYKKALAGKERKGFGRHHQYD